MGGESYDPALEGVLVRLMQEQVTRLNRHEMCAHAVGVCHAQDKGNVMLTEGDIIRSKPKPKRKPRRPKKGKR